MNRKIAFFLSQLVSPSFFVWGVLALSSLMLFALVKKYSSPIPYVDAWITAVEAAAPQIDPAWLWEQQNEHRYPIVKFLACLSYRMFGSMQTLCYLSVLLASVTSAGLILCARRLRGHTEWTDAVFPMILLHGSHFVNYLWSVQLFFVTAGCLACWCAIYLTALPETHRWSSTLGAALCLILLPLHGVMGLVFAFAFAFGFLYHGLCILRTNRRSVSAWFNVAAPCITGLLAILYVTTNLRLSTGSGSDLSFHVSLLNRFKTILECAATSLGYMGTQMPVPLGLLVFLFSVGTFAVLIWFTIQKELSKQEALSWLLILGAVWILPTAIGIGRSSAGGAAPRYGILTVPLIVSHILFWIWLSHLSSADSLKQKFSKFLQITFFTFFCAFFLYHTSVAIEFGKQRQEMTASFLSDIQAGLPYEAIAGRNWGYWCWSENSLASALEKMKSFGVKPFDSISNGKLIPSKEIPLPAQTQWEGNEPVYIQFRLPFETPRRVKAVRLFFNLTVPQTWSDTQVLWDSDKPFQPHQSSNHIKTYMGNSEIAWTIWIDDDIDRFVLVPQTKGYFKIKLLKAEILDQE